MSKQSKKKQLHNRLETLFTDLDEGGALNSLSSGVGDQHGWLWECDQDGVFTACSPELRNVLGYSPDEILGEKLASFSLTDQGKTELKNALRRKVFPTQATPTYLTKESSPVKIQLDIFKKMNPEGETIGWHGSARLLTTEEDLIPPLIESKDDSKSLVLAEVKTQPIPQFSTPDFEEIPRLKADETKELQPLDLQPAEALDEPVPSDLATNQSSHPEPLTEPITEPLPMEPVAEEPSPVSEIIEKRSETPAIGDRIAPDAKGLLEIIAGGEKREWNQEELALVDQVASQLSLAMENANLFQQTQEALAETDVLYQASADLNAANEYMQIIEAIHKHAIPHYKPILTAINWFNVPFDQENLPGWVEVVERKTDLPTQKLKIRYQFAEVDSIVQLANPDHVVHISEISTHPNITPETIEQLTDLFSARSALLLPIVVAGQWLGFIDMYFNNPTFFGPADLRRINNISIQAVEKINSVYISRQDQTRREIADQLNSVARAMSEMVSENDLIELTAELIFNRINPDQLTLYSFKPEENTLKVVLRNLAVPDATEDSYQLGDIIPIEDRPDLETAISINEPTYTAQDWANGFLKEHYCIPWFIEDRIAGIFEFYHIARSASITEHDKTYIEGVILQASSSIERARLFEQTQEALQTTDKQARRLRILNQMSDELTLATTVDQIYRISITNITDILQSDRTSIGIFDPAANQYNIVAVTGEEQDISAGQPADTEGIIAAVLERNQIIQNPESRLDNGVIQSTMVAPISIGGTAIGTINVSIDSPDAFEQADENIMQQIISLLSGVLENNRLFTQIQRRSLQLETSAEVSRTASTILDTVELLPQVVNLIKDGYNLYYVGLFMIDTTGQWTGESNRWAVLQAGTGEAGLEMLRNGHKLEIGGTSMIGTAIQNREARIALDVGEEARFFRNPYLPDTRSEMALPLISRGTVIGALSIQSTEQAAFSQEDITALQTMADQVANTIENATLFEQTEDRAEELAILNEMARAFTQSLEVDTIIDSVYEYTSRLMDTTNFYLALHDPETDITEIKFAMEDGNRVEYPIPKEKTGKIGPTEWIIQNKQPLFASENVMDEFERLGFEKRGRDAESWLGVPMLRGNVVIGVMAVQSFNAPRVFDGHHLDLLSAVANQATVAIDNAQRFQESQTRAQREQILREITAKVHSSADPDTILRTAVREVTNALGRKTFIRIGEKQLSNGTLTTEQLPEQIQEPSPTEENGHSPDVESMEEPETTSSEENA